MRGGAVPVTDRSLLEKEGVPGSIRKGQHFLHLMKRWDGSVMLISDCLYPWSCALVCRCCVCGCGM